MRGLSRLLMLLNARPVRFAGVGFVATATDFLVFNIGLAGDGDPSRTHVVIANTTAFAVATLVGYALNSRLTWGVRHERRFLVRYVLVAMAGAPLYDAALVGLLEGTQAQGYMALNAIKAGAVAVSATWNFFGFSYFVFRDREPARTAAPGEARP